MSDTPFDPRRRQLCPDGSCIGVIGDDGRCRACGLAVGGASPAGPTAATAAYDGGYDEPDSEGATDGYVGQGAPDSPAEGEDFGPLHAVSHAGVGEFRPDRRLCEDGACVGVVGDDGLCSVCGRPAAST